MPAGRWRRDRQTKQKTETCWAGDLTSREQECLYGLLLACLEWILNSIGPGFQLLFRPVCRMQSALQWTGGGLPPSALTMDAVKRWLQQLLGWSLCVRTCVRACVRACVCAWL